MRLMTQKEIDSIQERVEDLCGTPSFDDDETVIWMGNKLWKAMEQICFLKSFYKAMPREMRRRVSVAGTLIPKVKKVRNPAEGSRSPDTSDIPS